jgi:putative inorganic carbon (HCO3(-)) transporter
VRGRTRPDACQHLSNDEIMSIGARPPASPPPAGTLRTPANVPPQTRPVDAGAPRLPDYDYVSSLVMLLFCGYVVQWYLQLSVRMPALGAMRFEFVYAAALGALAIFKGIPLSTPITVPLLAFFGATYLQVLFSQAYDESYNIFIDRVLKFFCMTVFIAAFVKGPKHLKWFLMAFLLACMKMGQEGLHGKLTGGLVWQNQGVLRLHGPTPNYLHPNSFAGMALGTLPFVFYLYPLANRWQRAALALQTLFAGNIVLFSASRTGYVGFLGMVGTIVAKSRRKGRAIILTSVLALVSIPLIPADYIDRFVSIGTRVEKEGRSAETREEILRDAWQIFQMYPLGVGVGAFPYARYMTFGRIQDTHNLYLEVATNLGIQGLLVFLALVGVLLRTLGRLAGGFEQQLRTLDGAQSAEADERWRKHVADLKLMAAAAHAVQVFVIVRLCLGIFGMDLYEIYWWFAMGVCIALCNMKTVAQARTTVLLGAAGAPDKAPLPRARFVPRHA